MANKKAIKDKLHPVEQSKESESQPQLKPVQFSVTPSVSKMDQLDSWLKKNMRWVFFFLVLSWIGVRVVYYTSIVKSPLYSYYSLSESDNRFFDDWGKYLNGDWLNAKPFHPYHSWHKSFADAYFENHPEQLKEILAGNTSNDSSFVPGKALWNEWYHGNQYHQEPLYSYILAVFYHFHIDEVRAMILLQLFLGVLSGALLFYIARKYFGETTAVLTGVLYLFCGILMYNEIILLRTSWIVFFTMLNVVAMDRVFSSRKPLDFLLCGLCFGLSFLMQSTSSLYVIGVLVIALFVKRESWKYYIRNSGLLLLGFFVMFSPVLIRNKIVGAPTFSISSVGPPDIISCNVYGTTSISGWSPSAKKEVDLLARANKSLTTAFVAALKTYPSIGPYISLEWQKLKAAWVGIEYPNNENFYFYKQYVPVLRFCFLNFFLIVPFGLAGLIFCIYYRREYYSFYIAIVIQLVALLLIFVLARFRAPLVILLLPFAAFALVECINLWNRRKQIVYVQYGIIGLLLFLSYAGYSTSLDDELIKRGNYNIVFVTYFHDRLADFEATKQWDKWLALQQQFIDMAPEYIKNNSTDEGLKNVQQIYISQIFEGLHKQRKGVYDIIKDTANASKEKEIIKSLASLETNSLKSLNISPRSLDTYNTTEPDNDPDLNLALSFNESKQYDSAILYFNKFFANSPKNADIKQNSNNYNAMYTLAGIFVEIRKYQQAIDLLHKLLACLPDDEDVNMKIGEAFLSNGQYDSSEVHDKKALALNPKNSDALNNLAGVYFYYKKYPQAVNLYKKAIELRPDFVDPYANTGACYYYLKKYDSAIVYENKAILVNSSYRASYSILAVIYKSMGKSDSARKYDLLSSRK